HGRNQLRGVRRALSEFVAQHFSVGGEIAVHSGRQLDMDLHRLVVVKRAEFQFGRSHLLLYGSRIRSWATSTRRGKPGLMVMVGAMFSDRPTTCSPVRLRPHEAPLLIARAKLLSELPMPVCAPTERTVERIAALNSEPQ